MCNTRIIQNDRLPKVTARDDGWGNRFSVTCLSCGVYRTRDVCETSAEDIRSNHISWHSWYFDLEPIFPLLQSCFCTELMLSELCEAHVHLEFEHRASLTESYYSAVAAGEPDDHLAIQAYKSILENPGLVASFNHEGETCEHI
jgi:hypothetical protein